MCRQTNVSRTCLLFILLFIYSSFGCSARHWQVLAPGIEYLDIQANQLSPWSHIHAFRLDLTKTKLSLVNARDIKTTNASAEKFATENNALIGINAGFFDHQFKPLGLRVSHYRQTNPIKPISWWGVFYIESNIPHIASVWNFKMNKHIEFALQSGPRLLVNGKIPHLKQGIADRTALCITKTNKVIMVVSTNAAMTTKDLAELLQAAPLSCENAINLDGGSSSQIYADINSFHLNVHGFANVADAVIVSPISN
jgi:uncharacterized protein YigE (DUF2233 family)